MPFTDGYACCAPGSAYAAADGDIGIGTGSSLDCTGDAAAEGEGVSGRGCRSLSATSIVGGSAMPSTGATEEPWRGEGTASAEAACPFMPPVCALPIPWMPLSCGALPLMPPVCGRWPLMPLSPLVRMYEGGGKGGRAVLLLLLVFKIPARGPGGTVPADPGVCCEGEGDAYVGVLDPFRGCVGAVPLRVAGADEGAAGESSAKLTELGVRGARLAAAGSCWVIDGGGGVEAIPAPAACSLTLWLSLRLLADAGAAQSALPSLLMESEEREVCTAARGERRGERSELRSSAVLGRACSAARRTRMALRRPP